MNYYETLYIIHPALDGGRVKEMVLSVSKTLESAGGSPKSLDVWGKKKLAYEIDKQRYGTYVLVQFTGDGSGNVKFNKELEHNPNVLAYLTIRIDEVKMHEQGISLDDQIIGSGPPPAKDNTSEKTEEKAEEQAEEKTEEKAEEKPEEQAEEKAEEKPEEQAEEKPEESSEKEEDAPSEEPDAGSKEEE